VHLRAALPSQIEVPAYAEGLIAFYEGKYEEALEKAKQAFEQAPWLYEAKKLEGDARFMLGSRHRHDADFDWAKMMVHFEPGAEAYRHASEIARSAPDVHRAECELWFQIMCSEAQKGGTPHRAFERARDACERSVLSSSAEKRARMQQAHVHSAFALNVSGSSSDARGDPQPFIDGAIRYAEDAVRLDPGEPMAHFVLGNALWGHAVHAIRRGIDPGDAIERAIAAYESALRIDPRFLWALTELAQVYYQKMILFAWRGVDVTPLAAKAIEVADRAISLDPSSPVGPYSRALPHVAAAEQRASAGQSPEEPLALARQAVESSRLLAPMALSPVDELCLIHKVRARYDIDSGADPAGSLSAVARCADDMTKLAPDAALTHESLAAARFLEARHLLRDGNDPLSALEKARASFDRAIAKDPRKLNLRVDRARADILALRWAVDHEGASDAMFEAALAPLRPLLAEGRDDPSLYDAAAEIFSLRARFHLAGGATPDDDLTQGLAMAEKALSKNPHLGTALATKGQLLLLRASAARDPEARAQAARSAGEAFTSAFRENPLLERSHGAAAKEAAALR
jgi:tetratricopeptide (TPR) repeat protein